MTIQGQDPETPETAPNAVDKDAEIARLVAELDSAKAERDKNAGIVRSLRDENAARRTKSREAAEEAGEYKKAAEIYQQQIAEKDAELEKMRPGYAKYLHRVEKMTAEVDAKVADLPEALQAHAKSIVNVDERAAFVDTIAKELAHKKPPTAAPAAAPAPAQGQNMLNTVADYLAQRKSMTPEQRRRALRGK